jgi:hypothetical protein
MNQRSSAVRHVVPPVVADQDATGAAEWFVGTRVVVAADRCVHAPPGAGGDAVDLVVTVVGDWVGYPGSGDQLHPMALVGVPSIRATDIGAGVDGTVGAWLRHDAGDESAGPDGYPPPVVAALAHGGEVRRDAARLGTGGDRWLAGGRVPQCFGFGRRGAATRRQRQARGGGDREPTATSRRLRRLWLPAPVVEHCGKISPACQRRSAPSPGGSRPTVEGLAVVCSRSCSTREGP